jgi:tripartite-type tricarboxylate transporter receptor subunit TctC
MEDGSWYGLFAPAGTPPDIVRKLQPAIAKTLAIPYVRDRIISWGQEPLGTSPQEFQAFPKADVARSVRVVEAAKTPKLD